MITLKCKKPEPMTALEELLETGGNSVTTTTAVLEPVEIEQRSVISNMETIKERTVICKDCGYEFTVTSVRQHETAPERGYVTCPQCATENNIKKISLFPCRRRHRANNDDPYYTE